MEQRKLIKLGNSSYALALPKEWIDKSGLKKGDSIFIVPNSNGELVLMPILQNTNKVKEISIDLEKKNISTLRKEAAAAYVRGYDLFHFGGKKDKDKSEKLKKFLGNLLSLETIEEKEDSFSVKDFFSLEEINQENFIRRMDNNLREIFDMIVYGIKKGSITNQKIKEIEDADHDINKFYFLSSRILFRGIDNPSILSTLKTDSLTLLGNWWLSFNLEKIGDYLKSLAETIKTSKLNENQVKTINNLLVKIKDIYIKSLEAFYKKDKEIAMEISDKGKEIWKECGKLSKSGDVIVVKISGKLKDIEEICYQNAKMVLYTKI